MEWLIFLGYVPIVALLVVAIDRVRPHCRRRTLVLGASLPMPLLLTALSAYGVATIGPPGPDEIDAGAMAMMALMMIGTVGSFMLLVIGVIVATVAASYLRSAEAKPDGA